MKSELRLKGVLENEPEVKFAYLFGSQVTGPKHAKSDIDIAIFFNPDKENLILKSGERLQKAIVSALKVDDIDLHILNFSSLPFQFRIISEGKLIFCRDEEGRIDFETSIYFRYFDFKPYLDEYYRLSEEKLVATGNKKDEEADKVFKKRAGSELLRKSFPAT